MHVRDVALTNRASIISASGRGALEAEIVSRYRSPARKISVKAECGPDSIQANG